LSAIIRSGVIGHPIAHSLSPKLHNYWLDKYNINGEYKAYDIAPESLEHFLRSMPEKGFAGCNITIPHKEKAMKFVDELEPGFAQKIGAINTIVVKDGKLVGSNTDYYGFLENLKAHGHIIDKRNVLVLGAGGAARPICAGLLALGCSITLVNRSVERARELAATIGEGQVEVMPWKALDVAMKHKSLLVNATSLGMQGQPPLDISLDTLPIDALVTDIVYKPLVTHLLAMASRRGNPVVDGLGMLLHQAAPGFKAWFGLDHLPGVDDRLRQHILAP